MPDPRPCYPCSPEQNAIWDRIDRWDCLHPAIVFLTLGVCVYLGSRDEGRGRYTCKQFIPTAMLLSFELGYIIEQLIMYIGLPTFLTFGYEIGGFLPRTCEESKPLLGDSRGPCVVEKVGAWTTAYRATIMCLVPLAVVTVVAVPCIRHMHRKGMKEKAEKKVREDRRQLAEIIGEEILTMREEQGLLEDGKAMENLA